MTDDGDWLADRIAELGREEVTARLRSAFEAEAEAAEAVPGLGAGELDRLVAEAVPRAGGALWRRGLAGAAVAELGIGLAEAVSHPAVVRAHELVAGPAYEPPAVVQPPPPAEAAEVSEPVEEPPPPAEAAEAPEPVEEPPPPTEAAEVSEPVEEPPPPAEEALRLPAVHLGGIESLRAGERDLELRLSPAGLDVLKRSSGAAIGRLEWSEIQEVELPRQRRRLRPRARRTQELHVATDHGRASFELPGLTEEQLREHLEPMLARTRDVAT